jgi:hypothetical protein
LQVDTAWLATGKGQSPPESLFIVRSEDARLWLIKPGNLIAADVPGMEVVGEVVETFSL